MSAPTLLLGIDGGGTNCRARLTSWSGEVLGETVAGPANLRLGIDRSFAAVLQATAACLEQADHPLTDAARIIACLALAGASEPEELAKAQAHKLPFHKTLITTDARAACVGAHGGDDGGVIIVGTGSIAWGTRRGHTFRIGGWGLQLSDEGSGAWVGREALRRVLMAHDGRLDWTELLTTLFRRFHSNPHEIVRWAAGAVPADYGVLAPEVVRSAAAGDAVADEIMAEAAGHVDKMAARLVALGVDRIALVGGLSGPLAPRVNETTRAHLVPPKGDALQGALHLARAAAQDVSGAGESAG